jgi:O-antigen/teichoic acid export membrane protein
VTVETSLPTPRQGGAPGDGTRVRAGSLRAAVFRGGIFLFVRQICSILLSLLGVMLITRVIGPRSYGTFAAALGIYQYCLTLGQMGVGTYLIRHQGDLDEREYDVAYAVLLALGIAVVVLVELFMGALAGWVRVAGFAGFLRVMMLGLPLQLLAVPASARLERALNYRQVATCELMGQLAYYLVAVPMVAAGEGAWSLVIALLVQQASLFLLLHAAARRLPALAIDGAIIRRIVRYTASFTFANWLWMMRALVNPLIVGHFAGDVAVGQVGMTIRLVEMLTFMKAIAWRLSVAGLAKIQHNRDQLRRAITEGMQLQTLAIGPTLVGFAWVGGFLVPLVFGARWTELMVVYPFIALSYLTNAEFNMHSSSLFVLRRNWSVSAFHAAHVALFAGTAWFLVPKLGIVGYGWAEVAALLSYAVIHIGTERAVGSPDYRIAALWWAGLALGLFWRELGIWCIAAPFAALLWPTSVRQLALFYRMARGAHAE